MNPRKLMAVALCAAACATTTAFAEDDFGIESASPIVIADPVNPQPGMILSGYKAPMYPTKNWFKESVTSLPKSPAIKTAVDTSESFSLTALGATESNAGMWSGFLKCKRAGVYTLTITVKHGNDRYALRVNGKPAIVYGRGQSSADVLLKPGWNKVELVCRQNRQSTLDMSYKPKESLSDARPLTPAMMFYDKKP
ncbi:MAG: hypothetical protein J6V72_17545, partial [Kiritimatiellae bacterium]|nr:hypothetical protein [Kiritimatiellia bacterium]